jgi:hypothetical protein
VLLLDYSKNEYIGEIDLGFYAMGLGVVGGGGKKIVKFSFQ